MMLLSTDEYARQNNISGRTARRLCRDGKLDAVRVNHGWLISQKQTSGRDTLRRKGYHGV